MHMDAPFCDVVLVVRTWMHFMMCYMFVLHVDAPCVFYVMRHDVCMIRHMDALMVLWFMYMDANVDAMQSFWFFIYIFGGDTMG